MRTFSSGFAPAADVLARLAFVLFFVFAAVLVLDAHAAKPPPGQPQGHTCDERRDACRRDCFDSYAESNPAEWTRCREQCNQAWLACVRKR